MRLVISEKEPDLYLTSKINANSMLDKKNLYKQNLGGSLQSCLIKNEKARQNLI
ncbi:hypothetical protein OSCI_990011 [Kamptonema sp. PCC 6506]|nr:hypothetical protein OSCI_990011 [Kamptonema sp. PCC 6506]